MSHRPSSLAAAARLGNEQYVRELIHDGAALEDREEGQFTPLMLAAYYGHDVIVETLLSEGADPNAQTSKGADLLILAIHSGHHECLRALLSGRADPSVGTDEGHLPLHEAVARGDEISIRLLLRAGADPNVYGGRGRTPLHESARTGHAGIARALLEHGANHAARSRDDLQWTPWYFAKQAGHGPVLAELRRVGGASSAPLSGVSLNARVRSRLANPILSPFFRRSELCLVAGLNVRIRSATEKELIILRVSEAIGLIQTHQPRVIDRMRRSGITVWIPSWLPGSLGAYYVDVRSCAISSEYILAPDRAAAESAGVIVHEAVHARTWTPASETEAFVRGRTERLSCEAQRDFLAKIPGASELARAVGELCRVDPIVWSRRALTRANLDMLRDVLKSWLSR